MAILSCVFWQVSAVAMPAPMAAGAGEAPACCCCGPDATCGCGCAAQQPDDSDGNPEERACRCDAAPAADLPVATVQHKIEPCGDGERFPCDRLDLPRTVAKPIALASTHGPPPDLSRIRTVVLLD